MKSGYHCGQRACSQNKGSWVRIHLRQGGFSQRQAVAWIPHTNVYFILPIGEVKGDLGVLLDILPYFLDVPYS